MQYNTIYTKYILNEKNSLNNQIKSLEHHLYIYNNKAKLTQFDAHLT